MTRCLVRALPVVALAFSSAVVLLAAPLSLGGRGTDDGPRSTAHASSSWSCLLRDHIARYPLAQAEDVYKFVHQSVFGPAHAIPSREEAKRYLDEELVALPPGPANEPQVEVLSDEPKLVRLNLRPYVAAGGDQERLLDAFVATAAQVHGSPAVMKERLDVAVAVLRELGCTEAARQLDALAAGHGARGYPAAHHSEAYRDAYRPAYRVVLRALLTEVAPERPARATAK